MDKKKSIKRQGSFQSPKITFAVVGSSKVGKTSLVDTIISEESNYNVFNEKQETLLVNFEYSSTHNVQFWDFSGEELEEEYIYMLYNLNVKIDCFIIVVSTDQSSSLDELDDWNNYVKNQSDYHSTKRVVVVNNKAHFPREFKISEIKNKCASIDAPFYVVSLFEKQNVEKFITELSDLVINNKILDNSVQINEEFHKFDELKLLNKKELLAHNYSNKEFGSSNYDDFINRRTMRTTLLLDSYTDTTYKDGLTKYSGGVLGNISQYPKRPTTITINTNAEGQGSYNNNRIIRDNIVEDLRENKNFEDDFLKYKNEEEKIAFNKSRSNSNDAKRRKEIRIKNLNSVAISELDGNCCKKCIIF